MKPSKSKKGKYRISKNKKYNISWEVYIQPKDSRKIKEPIGQKTVEEETTDNLCSLCYENTPVFYLNCKHRGLYTKNFKARKNSNKPLCKTCIDRISNDPCPFCRRPNWTNILDKRYPKKKKSFAERLILKQLRKKKLMAKRNKRTRRFALWKNMIAHGRDPGPCPWFVPRDPAYGDVGEYCDHCLCEKKYHKTDPFYTNSW
ncbi:MAG: hypothetical protein V3W20_09460 [Candidatus Neomarinimicrobiota bacterium]